MYDNGSEFKLHFQSFCEDYGIKCKPTTIKNPTANAVLERMHGVVGNMMQTRQLDGQKTLTDDDIDEFIVNAARAVHSTYHTVLGSSPGSDIFGRDMLFDIPYLVDWTKIGNRRQAQINCDALRKNKERVDFDYKVGRKCLLRKEGTLQKSETRFEGPYLITQI